MSIQQKFYFGRYQKYVTYIALICFQMLIVPLATLCFYALIFRNIPLIILLISISILQYPVKKSEKFIKFVQKYIVPTNYFQKFQRIKEEQIDSNQKIMYGFHPHSIYSYTILLNMHFQKSDGIPDFIGLGSRFGYNVPILGFILRLWGCQSVSPFNVKSRMKEGKNIGLVPGGYQQASLTTTKQMRLYIKKRKGFIKYALKYGYTIRPVLCFGEYKAFQNLDIMSPTKFFLSRMKIPSVFFINKKYFTFIDPNIQITTIYGKGIRRKINENDTNSQKSSADPSIQQIQYYHTLYIEQIKRIYEKYKYLNDNKNLIIY